jgi:hypothetical protein
MFGYVEGDCSTLLGAEMPGAVRPHDPGELRSGWIVCRGSRHDRDIRVAGKDLTELRAL